MIIAAYIGLLTLGALVAFQILLILGKPLGEYAWGGQHKVLSRKLRISSVSSIAVYVILAVFLSVKSGLLEYTANSDVILVGMWIFTGYLFIGVLINFISRSKKERLVMTPVAAVLAMCFLIVTLG